MDITFEEVAHVIQDARYQQAIFDPDTPRPERKIPVPPRNFSVDNFVRENNVTLRSVLAEPLGRFFLGFFVDGYAEFGANKSNKSEEARCLRFARVLYRVRRRDPNAVVSVPEVLRLLRDFQLIHRLEVPRGDGDSSSSGSSQSITASEVVVAVAVDGSASEDGMLASSASFVSSRSSSAQPAAGASMNGSGKKFMSSNSHEAKEAHANALRSFVTSYQDAKLLQESPDVEVSFPDVVTNLNAGGDIASDRPSAGPEDNGIEYSTTSSKKVGSVKKLLRKGKKAAAAGAVTFTTNNSTAVTRYNSALYDGASSQGKTVSTSPYSIPNQYSASAAAVVARANSHIVHTRQSMDLSDAVQRMMEDVLSPVYKRLHGDRRTFTQYVKLKWYSLDDIGDKQIRYHRVLGAGAFGTVHGCIVASVGTMLAMKIMLRKKIKSKRASSQVLAERQALEALAAHPSPYCMQLRYAYATKEAFHLVIPLAIGGDLKYHLHDGPFSEARARIYACEIAMGLGHIHSLGLIIRDLKPRNILLDSRGHCKISDLGLAVSIADGPIKKGRAGTEGYWSPEVINQMPYGVDADWWGFGCCLFELLAGFNPFSCKHTKLKSRNEGTRRGVINFTSSVPALARPLILGLLHKKVDSRLGCRGRGVDEVLNHAHAFWDTMDFGAVRRGEVAAPWVPDKGVIYAASQHEMQDNNNDAEDLRKIKLTPEDDIEFPPFVDIEDHQRDLVKVLEKNSDFIRQHVLGGVVGAGGGGGRGAGSTGGGSRLDKPLTKAMDPFQNNSASCCSLQ
jgi:serine/threonine protein kinase